GDRGPFSASRSTLYLAQRRRVRRLAELVAGHPRSGIQM
ncbi:MAG: hypothetical protein AVDCRST_MAG61-1113, partial [uncultured Friedmanniella sp.]